MQSSPVKFVTEQDYSVLQACLELGIGETVLRTWINKSKLKKVYVLAVTKRLPPEIQRYYVVIQVSTVGIALFSNSNEFSAPQVVG